MIHKKVIDTLIELSSVEIENKDELMNEVSNVLGSLQVGDVSKVKVSYALEEIMDLALSYGLKIPMAFVLFGKTVIILEGIALEYDPKFNIIASSKPFIEKLIRQRYNPVNVINNFMKSMIRFRKLSEELPEQASRALKRIEKGSIKVDIEDTDVLKLSSEIDRSSNRIAYSMLTAALLIVGALTIDKGEAFIFNMPLIPFFTFIAALVLSIILFISILREKNIIR